MNSLLIYLKRYTRSLDRALANRENSNSSISGAINHNGITIPKTDELQAIINKEHDNQIRHIIRNLEVTVNHLKTVMGMNSEDNSGID